MRRFKMHAMERMRWQPFRVCGGWSAGHQPIGYPGDDMNKLTLIAALGLATLSGVAAADTGFKTYQSGNVGAVYGRSGIPPVHAGSTIVTRTAQEVVPGPTTEEGPTAVAVGAGSYEVSHLGRS
jgi:hypothetical protein